MEIKHQTSQNVTIVSKKEWTVRSVLNLYGGFAFVGMILAVFTNPITLNNNFEFFIDKYIVLDSQEFTSFLLFIAVVATIYFSLVNVLLRKSN